MVCIIWQVRSVQHGIIRQGVNHVMRFLSKVTPTELSSILAGNWTTINRYITLLPIVLTFYNQPQGDFCA